jgi:cell division protein ZapA
MAQVSVTINGNRYDIACDDGQEAHVARLGSYIDRRVGELVAAVGRVGEDRLLVMVSLLLADELSDVYAELEALKSADEGIAARLSAEDTLGANMEKLAQRIDSIAESLERA